jgi:adenosine deaminase
MIELTEEIIRRMPKVLLHEHLDGCLRPRTILEIAEKEKIDLPETDPTKLGEWFHRGASRGSLPLYLEGFGTTIAVMQTKYALERYEAIVDAADDNIAYIELRFHPGFHTQKGLSLEDVMNSVLAGCARAEKETGVAWGLIVCAMRNMDPEIALEMAELAVHYRDKGVVGFDLAGDESGHPPKKHVEAFHYIQRENFNITIHAGEAFGMKSIWQAIQWCGAHRIGHATHLIEDMTIDKQGKILAMGTLAQYVLDKRIPLEICLLSNVQTGAAASVAAHPFPILFRYKFRLTVNTDNRLMSDTTMTKEFWTIVKEWGLTFDDLEKLNINAMKSAFTPYKKRLALIYNVIKPGFAKLRTEIED